MSTIVERVRGVVATVIQAHTDEMGLDKLDDRAAVQLAILLLAGAMESLAASAARSAAKTTEGADAICSRSSCAGTRRARRS